MEFNIRGLSDATPHKAERRLTSKKIKYVIFLMGGFFVSGSLSYSTEIFGNADSYGNGAWSVAVLGRTSNIKPTVKISGTDAIQIPTTGGSNTIFSESNANIKMEQSGDEMVAALSFQPRDGFSYLAKIGQIQNFDLEFSSGSLSNEFKALKNGFLWGVGIGKLIAPGSLVSAAISINLSYTERTISLDRFESGGVVSAANHRFEQDEFQGVVNISRRWKKVEPYGGLKVMHFSTHLIDDSTKGKVSGRTDGISPFLGIQWEVFDRENFIVEGSLGVEKSIDAGFKMQFGD
jgi:hypothetical protein